MTLLWAYPYTIQNNLIWVYVGDKDLKRTNSQFYAHKEYIMVRNSSIFIANYLISKSDRHEFESTRNWGIGRDALGLNQASFKLLL